MQLFKNWGKSILNFIFYGEICIYDNRGCGTVYDIGWLIKRFFAKFSKRMAKKCYEEDMRALNCAYSMQHFGYKDENYTGPSR